MPTKLREMIANAREWATARNLIRKNEVHKREEFRIPTSDEFSFTTSRTREAEATGSFSCDDLNGSLMDFGDLTAEGAMLHFGCCTDITNCSDCCELTEKQQKLGSSWGPLGSDKIV
jgi:hypothetical protein